MKPFRDRTKKGNEQAIRKGKKVPSDAVNMAWFDAPKFKPDTNVLIFDTSAAIEENLINDYISREIYYANDLGILEDVYGNQIIEDERPVVTDEFLVDEDFSAFPAEEYSNDDVLPYSHRSRYFHVDHAGLALPGDMTTYETVKIRVVDAEGNEYVDEDGHRRYKVKIHSAPINETGDENAYRVHVFIDSDEKEGLYLIYDKIEIDKDGFFFGGVPGYRELLNPLPFFGYTPEESEVVDYINRRRKIYSSKPHSFEEQVLGATSSGKRGYKVYVPKKAIGDPREYQLFRWRALCEFRRSFKVDPSDPAGIRCGVVVTSDEGNTATPYSLLNLSRSQYNALQLNFYNPLKEGPSSTVMTDEDDEVDVGDDPETASYWAVNINTVTHEELSQFHLLIWSPPANTTLDLGKYAGKIDYFTRQCGGTLFVDAGNRSTVKGLGIKSSVPVVPRNGNPNMVVAGHATAPVLADDRQFDEDHELLRGAAEYGGWDLNPSPDNVRPGLAIDEYLSSELNTMSWMVSLNTTDPRVSNRVQHLDQIPEGWDSVVRNLSPSGGYAPTLAYRTASTDAFTPGGNRSGGKRRGDVIVSTLGILDSTNMLVSHQTKDVVHLNQGDEVARLSDYRLYINSQMVEGAYKFLYNICLMALKNKPLDDSDEVSYSSVVNATSEWKFSWVIDGDVLNESERKRNEFTLMPTDDEDPVPVWQRKLSDKTVREIIDEAITPDMRVKVEGAEREYFIEVSNPSVVVPDVIDPDKKPHAWTNEYSPAFSVPVELGPNVIRAAEIPPGYKDAEYAHKTFPAKPFDARVVMSYIDTSEQSTTELVRWTATGTCTESFETGTYKPPVTTSKESEVELTWAKHGANKLGPSPYPWEKGMPRPAGIQTWQNYNYYASKWGTGSQNWHSYGIYQRLNIGSRGELVTWVQDAMNTFQFLGVFKHSTLKLDGVYGAGTKSCIRAFQVAMGARFIDGVVDAETLSLIGSQVLRFWGIIKEKRKNSGWQRFYYMPQKSMRREAISDGNHHSIFAKRSWVTKGPSIIWELFLIRFLQPYNIHGVTLIPYTEGGEPTVMFRSIDVRNSPYDLVNYDSRWGSPIWMPHRVRNNTAKYVSFAPRRGDTVIVGVGQDRGTGMGTSRMLGVRDIRAHARVKTTTVTPGVNTIKKQTVDRNITETGVVLITSPSNVKITIPAPKPENPGGVITNVNWNNITLSKTEGAILQRESKNNVFRIINNKTLATADRNTTNGPKIPDAFSGMTGSDAIWWKSANTGKIGPTPVNGWISKTDGVMLLCDNKGMPKGFPAATPVGSKFAEEEQRHYATLRIESVSNDPAVQVGFYDSERDEFITNVSGEPEMLYIEYLNRGPSNIYIGVVSTYEVDVNTPIPVDSTAPKIPYNWAMPVYGLHKRTGSRVGIGKLPRGLQPDEPWPIPIKTGSFHRKIKVRELESGSVDLLPDHQGHTLTAFYSAHESEIGGWSRLWGPPYVDVADEIPTILNVDTIRVSKSPIHAAERPTIDPSPADPVRPTFVVRRKDSVTGEWKKLPWSEIRDYNLSTGEIVLKTPIRDADESLFRVDYTTSAYEYLYRGNTDMPIDINPYNLNNKIEGLDKGRPIYVGLRPSVVKDEKGKVVFTEPNQSIFVTNDPSVFNPLDPNYNPMFIQLGMIVLTSIANLNDLRLIDTRTRGGGASSNMTVDEKIALADDSSNYWDMGKSRHSYQSSGFIVVRLPAELKERFSKEEIEEVIRKNATAGVAFRIEDLEGNDWSAE